MSQVILSVKNYNIKFLKDKKILYITKNISLDLYAGEVLALVGESGSGKSVFSSSLINLLGSNGYITGGKVIFEPNAPRPVDLTSLYQHSVDKAAKKRFIKFNNKEIKRLRLLENAAETEADKNQVTYKINILEKEIKLYSDILKNKGKYTKKYIKEKTRDVRGKYIATIFQDASLALNPLLSVGNQICESLKLHTDLQGKQIKAKAIDLLKDVGINNPEDSFHMLPSNYSGGMRQRVLIAIAIASNPKILIADEPTTALDVTIQAQIIELLKTLKDKYNMSIIFITHDLGVVANIANRVAIMYAGQIVEYGKTKEIFYDPKHPYTWSLLSSLPQLSSAGKKLSSLEGTPPSPHQEIIGDPFAIRNKYAIDIDFLYDPPFFKVSPTHYAKTWLLHENAPVIKKPIILTKLTKLLRGVIK
ncbi:MAG: ABC transporter ATP-binding protein [Mycoplasmataceae bacterium]|jgi:oligopeptide transport system ATP-binding protein|nr:ABC transporter ATP-binding protein [Mycoplasmataceae bacterium]